MNEGMIRKTDGVSANLLQQLTEMRKRIDELEELILTQDRANLLYEPLVGDGSVQAPNFVYAGPIAAPDATPSFRALVEADIPSEIARDTELHTAVSLDADAGVLLDLADQTIGLDTQTANRVFAGPSSGGANEPTFRTLVDDDIPNTLSLTAITLSDYVKYTGDLRPYRNSTTYTAYAYVPLFNGGSHSSWDGNDHKAPGSYTITVANWSNVPANCKAVMLEVRGQPTNVNTVVYLGGGALPVVTWQFTSGEVNKSRDRQVLMPLSSSGTFVITVANNNFNWASLRISGYFI